MGSIAVSPVQNASGEYNVYAGGGELVFSSDAFAGSGLFKSADGGQSWVLIEGPDQEFVGVSIENIVVVPDPVNKSKEIVFVTTNGGFAKYSSFGTTNGVYRSNDGGDSWVNITSTLNKVNGVLSSKAITDFTVDPNNPNLAYVAIGDPRLDIVQNNYKLNGIYRTESALTDAPVWTVAFGGTGTQVPGAKLGRIEVEIAPSSPSTVYAMITDERANTLLGLYRSVDSGINWRLVNNTPNVFTGATPARYNFTLMVDPQDENKIYLAGFNKVAMATNAAVAGDPTALNLNWSLLGVDADGEAPYTSHHDLTLDAAGRLLTATSGGLFRADLLPLGEGKFAPDWKSMNGNPGPDALNVVQVTGIGLHPQSAEQMYAGTQHNGVLRYFDDGVPGNQAHYAWPMVNPGNTGNVVYDFINPLNIYHVSQAAGARVWKSTDGGETWNPAANGIANAGKGLNVIPYAPLVMDPSNSKRLLFGEDQVYVTTNGADSWAAIGPNMPFVTGVTPPPGPPAVTAIGVSRFDGNVVYAAVNNRWRQIDNIWVSFGPALYQINLNLTGTNFPRWVDISPGNKFIQMPPIEGAPENPSPNLLGGPITDIAVDPFDSNIAYITVDTVFGSRVYRTTNGAWAGGAAPTWVDISGSGDGALPARAYSIALDPILLDGPEDDDLYVGTAIGVYVLRNPTTNNPVWTRVGGDEFPDVMVTDLEINTTTGILAAGTYGRGVWQLQIRPFISGFVFEDLNGNGFRDPSDPGLPDIQIIAQNLNKGVEQANTRTRSPDGYWEFRSLPDQPGFNDQYRIRANLVGEFATFQVTTPLLGDADLTGDPFYDDVTRFTTLTNQNIGLFRRTSIQGVKFDDLNGNGKRDPGEPGLPGWTIELLQEDPVTGKPIPVLDKTGQPVRVVTGPDGKYSFNNLGVIQTADPTQPSGRRVLPYFVREIPQIGYVPTLPRTTDLLGPITLTSGTPSVGNDFGNFQVFSLTGVKFEDINGNGVRDPGEPGLANWVIQLLDSTGQPVRDSQNQPIQVLTDADGKYVFNNLPPRYDANGKLLSYRVREELQSGWAQTTANPPDVPPQSGKVVSGGDFGNFQLVTISGSVFDDTNGNGIQDPGEVTPVSGGFAILVNTANNQEVDRVPIGGDGAFAFPDRRPLIVDGKLVPYTVRLEPAAGYVQTSESPAPFTITSGQSVTGLSFGVFRTTSISGQVFHDINGNGVQDGGEPSGLGVSGALVELIRADTGAVIPGTQQTIGADGKFTIANLGPLVSTPPGSSIPYRLRITAPDGWVMTSPNASFYPSPTVATNNIVLTSGKPVGPIPFGGFRLTEISGQVFNDLNGDGIRQPGETGGIPGAVVRIIDTRNGQAIAETTTDTDGTYVFSGRGPLLSNNINAPYRVEVVPPTGFVITGTDNTEVVLRSATPAANRDFAGFRLITISGKAFNDLNGNGVFDKNELTLPGWEIQLKNLTTGVTATAVTDKAGVYTFPNLGPGVYQVRELVRPGWVQTTPNPSDLPAVSGKDVSNVLFGNFRQVSITGRVFEDLNRDGKFDPNEQGIPGITVNLLDANGKVIRSLTTDKAGGYAFAELGPGTYSAKVVLPTSFIATEPVPPISAPINPQSGENFPDTDFGILRLGSIESFVFLDTNRNRRQDAREPRLEGVQVFLRDARDVVVRETLTNKNGEFAFFDLEPGKYKIQFLFGEAGAGFVFSNPDFPNGFPVTVTAGSDTPGNRFTQGLGIASTPVTVTGADAGGGPHVQVFDALTGFLKSSFFAFDPSFTGGVRVAQGDLTGNGVNDYITVVGPGGAPEVRAYNGVTGELLFSFFAYEPSFTGGMFVAAGDVNGDGIADIITGTDVGGGPRVQIFDGKTREVIHNYFAYESTFRGGVRVAAGDVNGDGFVDIITTPAEGGGPRVTVFDGRDLTVLSNFFAFDPDDRAGVYVAAGDFTGNNLADILVGQGATINPLVRLYTASGDLISSAPAFPPDEFGNEFKSEVRVAVTDRYGDGKLDAVVTSGPGSITRLRFLDVNLVPAADELRPYTSTFTGGVFVG
jgi:uncharacterized protein (DUF2141 family)